MVYSKFALKLSDGCKNSFTTSLNKYTNIGVPNPVKIARAQPISARRTSKGVDQDSKIVKKPKVSGSS